MNKNALIPYLLLFIAIVALAIWTVFHTVQIAQIDQLEESVEANSAAVAAIPSPVPTATAVPTATPAPTSTPMPTATPAVQENVTTPTATPPSGDDLVDSLPLEEQLELGCQVLLVMRDQNQDVKNMFLLETGLTLDEFREGVSWCEFVWRHVSTG